MASDKTAVTSARAALAAAKANLTAATLTAPIGGTVGSVGYTKGSSSGSHSITIVGSGAVKVTVAVPLASMPKVKVGQVAQVTAGGSSTPLAGSVESISLLPNSSTSSSATYPVVVLVPNPTDALATGATASVAVVLTTAKSVVTVPNSAMATIVAGSGIVQVMKNGTVTRTIVKTGAVGSARTQVTSGLTAGQQVVLADISAALPTNSTATNRRFAGAAGAAAFGGGIGGAGGIAGGAPPAGAPVAP